MVFERSDDLAHVVQHGETLSEIAYLYDIEYRELARYNNLSNPDSIKVGESIRVPSVDNVRKLRDEPSEQEISALVARAPIRPDSGGSLFINADKQFDGTAVTARLFIQRGLPEGYGNFEWNLGNGFKSFRNGLSWTYDKPGTYTVRLKVSNRGGHLIESNDLHISVPYPGELVTLDQSFLTLGSVEEVFRVEGEVLDVENYGSLDASPLELLGREGEFSILRSHQPGYFLISSQIQDLTKQTYVFVSPIDSVHSDRNDINWYRTQFNTGTASNCGPSVVSMSVAWARGEYIAVSSIRDNLGWSGNGGTSFSELISQMRSYGVDSRLTPIASPQDVFDIVDDGNIAVVLFHTSAVSWTAGAPEQNLVGRYYNDSVGHYVIIKGYTVDGKYLVVYDPVPSDWVSNSKRHADGVSMMGRNRYYPVDEIFGALRRHDVIEIRR